MGSGGWGLGAGGWGLGAGGWGLGAGGGGLGAGGGRLGIGGARRVGAGSRECIENLCIYNIISYIYNHVNIIMLTYKLHISRDITG